MLRRCIYYGVDAVVTEFIKNHEQYTDNSLCVNMRIIVNAGASARVFAPLRKVRRIPGIIADPWPFLDNIFIDDLALWPAPFSLLLPRVDYDTRMVHIHSNYIDFVEVLIRRGLVRPASLNIEIDPDIAPRHHATIERLAKICDDSHGSDAVGIISIRLNYRHLEQIRKTDERFRYGFDLDQLPGLLAKEAEIAVSDYIQHTGFEIIAASNPSLTYLHHISQTIPYDYVAQLAAYARRRGVYHNLIPTIYDKFPPAAYNFIENLTNDDFEDVIINVIEHFEVDEGVLQHYSHLPRINHILPPRQPIYYFHSNLLSPLPPVDLDNGNLYDVFRAIVILINDGYFDFRHAHGIGTAATATNAKSRTRRLFNIATQVSDDMSDRIMQYVFAVLFGRLPTPHPLTDRAILLAWCFMPE